MLVAEILGGMSIQAPGYTERFVFVNGEQLPTDYATLGSLCGNIPLNAIPQQDSPFRDYSDRNKSEYLKLLRTQDDTLPDDFVESHKLLEYISFVTPKLHTVNGEQVIDLYIDTYGN